MIVSSRTAESLWRAYRVQLVVLNEAVNRDPETKKVIDPKIDELLAAEERGDNDWEQLNEAELRLIKLAPAPHVDAEITRRLDEAARVGLPSAAVYATALPGAATHEAKQALLNSLMLDLFAFYARRRLNRRARRGAAQRLNNLGLWLMAPLLVILVALIFVGDGGIADKLHIPLIMYFGLLGAYLSRMIAFQSALGTLDYGIIEQDFSDWSMFVRLITGVLGALVIYLLIIADLLGGQLFPTKDFNDFWRQVATTPPPDLQWTIPSANLAKLLIWSVIAGFSERLVPDQLTRLEGTTREKPPAKT